MTKKETAHLRELAEMAEHPPDQKTRDWFKRPAGVQVMIQAQAEQIERESGDASDSTRTD